MPTLSGKISAPFLEEKFYLWYKELWLEFKKI